MPTKTIFAAYDAALGGELWVTDGTEAGPYLLKDILSGAGDSNPVVMGQIGSKIAFSASHPTRIAWLRAL